MKVAVFSSFLVAFVYGQAQICAKEAEYSACASKASLNIANCNNLVSDTPTFDYWNCICNGYQASLNCYSICPDDPQLQLQRQSQEATTFGTCNYVQQQKALGKGAPKINTAPIAMGTKTISGPVASGATPTLPTDANGMPTLPPLPVATADSHPAVVDYSGSLPLNVPLTAFLGVVSGILLYFMQ